ncbi:MAG: class I SAM-dependent methyltransferase [Gammaproteobacteria bacterium]|nr:class I SAM-dependent methyltransferase [Gammaproteobacteria bacterium]MDH3449874.1 class I SAM-dependent methyltransferase [Gammaproteobacteria bacterium]
MSTSSLGLDDNLQQYLLEVSLLEPRACARLREQTLAMPDANMLSSPEQVQLLVLLCRLLNATNGLEIGTFTGYTSLRLTLALPRLRMSCCDVSEEFTAIARQHWREAGVQERIDLQLAPAQQTLGRLLDEGLEGAFDFAYIDADKTGYRCYVESCLILVRSGGLIMLDNVLWSGSVADPSDTSADAVALRELNAWIYEQAPGRYDLSLIPIGDGLTVLRKYG